MKKTMRYTAFALFLLALFLPALQKGFGLVEEKPLHGAFVMAENPAFTWKKWFSGEFQANFDRFIENHIGFRNSLVRLKNQLDFTLFREANAEGVVVGKEDYLYEYDYIRDFTGQDFVGMEFIRKKMMRAAFLQKFLKDSLDIDFIIVFEPGKASFHPDYIPEKYLRERKEQTNFKAYLRMADELGIKYIDFNEYFLQMKDTASHPLFPKYGTHWSVYGMSMAADSLIRAIESVRGKALREVRVVGYNAAREPRDTDNDVEKPLNLLCALPSEELAYPVWEIDTVSDRYRPMVLAVADSYYWNIFNTRIPKHLFANEAFWYFNAKVYPDTYYDETWVSDLDLKEEVEKQDVILLMVTERFMHKFDWQFIDMVYPLYAPGWLHDPVYINMNRVVDNDELFGKLILRAEKDGISLEEVVRTEAMYMYFTEARSRYLIDHGTEHFKRVIRGTAEWFEHIVQKAEEKNIPVEEQLKQDADYIFNQNYPGLFTIRQGIQELVDAMGSDPDSLDTLEAEAAAWGWRLEDYLPRKAFSLYRERQIHVTEQAIRSTPEWREDVRVKADKKGIPLDSMIRMDAEYVWEQRLK